MILPPSVYELLEQLPMAIDISHDATMVDVSKKPKPVLVEEYCTIAVVFIVMATFFLCRYRSKYSPL